jgi:hypothetical protein
MNDGRREGWLGSASFDLLFVANIAWPLLLLPGMSSPSETVVDFWQIYFLTLPHRWITLLLVAADPDRRRGLGLILAGLAIFFAALVGGAYFGTAAFLCLGAVDYVWNAWHFASQHAGVLRIYSKKSQGGLPWLERWGVRAFITYTICRTASGMLWGQLRVPVDLWIVRILDIAMLSIPIALLVTNLVGWNRLRWPKLIYLTSVMLLYSGYLVAGSTGNSRWILCFATAASMFHATEYLAIVTHYARRRETVGSPGIMRFVGANWIPILAIYMLVLGGFGWWVSHWSGPLGVAWQGINLWGAFTHYAYDGMIWKLRHTETARALGAA